LRASFSSDVINLRLEIVIVTSFLGRVAGLLRRKHSVNKIRHRATRKGLKESDKHALSSVSAGVEAMCLTRLSRAAKKQVFVASEANAGVIYLWASLKVFQKAQEPSLLVEVFHIFRL